jgi:hypothetical protein
MYRVAVSLIMAAMFASPIAAQSVSPQQKDPDLARRYSYYFSGAGHFYTGEKGKAFAMIGVSTVSFYKWVSVATCDAVNESFMGADTGCDSSNMLLWAAGTVAPYIYGIIDAPKSAARVNAKLKAAGTHAIIERRGSATRFGLSVALPSGGTAR